MLRSGRDQVTLQPNKAARVPFGCSKLVELALAAYALLEGDVPRARSLLSALLLALSFESRQARPARR